MDDSYDVIVLGTGLKECILSGLLSVDGKKVLHMDRNDYYGGESASLSLDQLWQKNKGADSKPPAALGQSRDYNVDLVPKFIMAEGTLVKMLIHTDVTRYLEFKSIAGSYVFKDGKIFKVPATDKEAMMSRLMGLFEKRRCKKFFTFIQEFKMEDPKTWGQLNMKKATMAEVFQAYGLDANTQSFLGHAMALYRDDAYLSQPATATIERLRLYAESLSRWGKSPYIYPLYGLGELPQAFARLSAIYGGTYMLNKPFEGVEYDADGKAVGVKSEGEVAKAPVIIGDPSYFEEKVKQGGSVVRCVCILSAPIPNTEDIDSVQIIMPQRAVNRKSDIYISCYGYSHRTAPEGKYIAIASTTVETSNPQKELDPALKLMGPIVERMYSILPMYVPTDDGSATNVFVSKSFDPTTHFQSTCEDVMSLYKRVTGKDVDLSPPEKKEDQ